MTATQTLGRAFGPLLPAFAVLGFFVWFSNWIPQTRWEPPRARAISAQMSPSDLARVGAVLVRERGCLTCHTIEPGVGLKGQGRGPNLAGLASRRAQGVPGGLSNLVSYLTQSLYEPGSYLVEGYANIMPASHRPPSKLTYEEVTAVVDYLMSLGGTPTVKVGDLPRPPAEASQPTAPASPVVAKPEASTREAMALLDKQNCITCHSLKKGEVLVGPPFDPVLLRENAKARGLGLEAYLMESIVAPRAFVRGDFKPDMMPDVYAKELTAGQLHTIVSYLAALEPKP
ncbi:MAG: c-type cytochrome [Hyphomicrobiaceae bacterium]|nr:MAG: c-type cytochrome [Hyphomicrobiaceae bacterium]